MSAPTLDQTDERPERAVVQTGYAPNRSYAQMCFDHDDADPYCICIRCMAIKHPGQREYYKREAARLVVGLLDDDAERFGKGGVK
jgi:hypothetical protein